jgi:hypothetical protein
VPTQGLLWKREEKSQLFIPVSRSQEISGAKTIRLGVEEERKNKHEETGGVVRGTTFIITWESGWLNEKTFKLRQIGKY